MTDPRKIFGEKAERVAECHLKKKGYRILERNVRSLLGEMDLVALDGETLVFCEVKACRSKQGFDPGASIHARKQARLARLAAQYLQQHTGYADWSCRFDAVLVWKTGPLWRVEIIADAFCPGW